MQKTELRNGVLFYLAFEDRKFAILGDAGINAKTGNDFWDAIKEEMAKAFINGHFTDGLVSGILKAGEQLKVHFPYQLNDVNELPDDISFPKNRKMRKLKILGLLFILVLGGGYASLAQQIPDPMVPKRMVNDFTGLFNPQEQNALETKLQHYLDTTSTQIYVVTVNTLDGQDIAAYAALMGDRWKIGQKGKDNGILLLIKPKNDEGKERFLLPRGTEWKG